MNLKDRVEGFVTELHETTSQRIIDGIGILPLLWAPKEFGKQFEQEFAAIYNSLPEEWRLGRYKNRTGILHSAVYDIDKLYLSPMWPVYLQTMFAHYLKLSEKTYPTTIRLIDDPQSQSKHLLLVGITDKDFAVSNIFYEGFGK